MVKCGAIGCDQVADYELIGRFRNGANTSVLVCLVDLPGCLEAFAVLSAESGVDVVIEQRLIEAGWCRSVTARPAEQLLQLFHR